MSAEIADLALVGSLRLARTALRLSSLDRAVDVAGAIGALFARVSRRARIGALNLQSVFGSEFSPEQQNRILEGSYRNFASSAAEFLLSSDWTESFIRERVRVADIERVHSIAAGGKGLILLTAHFGNWELASFLTGIYGYPTSVLVRRQKLGRSDAFLNRIRARWGAEVVTRGMNSRRIIRRLRSGGFAGILADQDAGRSGVYAPFFGKQASWPRGVARFARMTGATILPVFVVREGAARHVIHFGEVIPAEPGLREEEADRLVMKGFAAQLEKWIRKHPDHWLWAHRRWKTTPDKVFWILSDGKPGHFKQSLELYRRLARVGSGEKSCKVIELKFKSSIRRRILDAVGMLTGGHFGFARPFLRWALTDGCYREFLAGRPDVIISCGSGTEAAHLCAAKLNEARGVFVQKPQYGQGRFNAVLVPKHDDAGGRNVIRTTGALSAQKEAEPVSARGAIVGLLIGGPSRHAEWPESFFVQVAEEVAAWASQAGWEWRGTSSRRTMSGVDSASERLCRSSACCGIWISPNKENPPGAYDRILSQSRLLVVTGDSISMVSEALGSGARVVVVIPNQAGAETKLSRFIASLETAAQVIEVGGLRAELTKLSLESGESGGQVIDVNEAAVARVAELLGLGI